MLIVQLIKVKSMHILLPFVTHMVFSLSNWSTFICMFQQSENRYNEFSFFSSLKYLQFSYLFNEGEKGMMVLYIVLTES